MPFSRVRVRLAAWNLATFSLVLVATLGAAVIGVVREHEAAIEQELRFGAAREALRFERARHEEREEHEDREEHDPHERAHDLGEAPDLLVSWAREDGAVALRAPLAGLPDEAALAAALRGEETRAEHNVDGVPLRLLTVPVRHEGRVIGAVQVAKPLGAERQRLSQTLLTLVITSGAGLLVAVASSFFLAGRAMGPIGEAFDRQRRFIADASHELRTPVAVLCARAELLRREPALPAAAQAELGLLQRDAEELSQLLSDLLDLARLDAGEPAPALEPVALADAAEELGAQLAPLAVERRITLSIEAAPVWAETHLPRLRQVLRAFVDNALRHTPPGGHVTIAVDRDNGRARVRVRDDGTGIAPEHLPRIFDRFYRADPARARGGAGLGLSIAAELVRLLRGEVHADSAPGKGTTLTLWLPLAAEMAPLADEG
ncbi:MAG: ATP-binding protein [Byssovorax sp.]